VSFRIEGESAEEVISEDARQIVAVLSQHTRRSGEVARVAISAAAPRDTGRLARSFTVERAREAGTGRFAAGWQIAGGAVRGGFAYLDTTRFGHRQAIIRPRRGRYLKVYAQGRQRGFTYRRQVRGYRPGRDWVAAGVAAAMLTLGREQASVDAKIDTILIR